VRDGEGITKAMEITVTGAATDASAKIMALSIANSPLVKTAIAGADANWGRIIMAAGKTGEPANRDTCSVLIGDHAILQSGKIPDHFDETPIAEYMQGNEISIHFDAATGKNGTATVWSSDLTHEYIDINADYRS